ncbi:hypothetical protein BDV10DRAFT_168088 [Aspergillus recurvatus]
MGSDDSLLIISTSCFIYLDWIGRLKLGIWGRWLLACFGCYFLCGASHGLRFYLFLFG